MEAEYDLKKMKHVRNPYLGKITKPVTFNLSKQALEYFENVAQEKGIRIETLINFYLLDCAQNNRLLDDPDNQSQS